jgi:hypothetical protein
MLARKEYTRQEIKTARELVDQALRAYKALPAAAKTKEFEAFYFNREVRLLDHMFMYRMMAIEGKDGNPLVEVRVLCNSLLLNGGILQVEKLPDWPDSAGAQLKLPPEKSVLKLKARDEVKLTQADFVRLSTAFFATLEEKFSGAHIPDSPLRLRKTFRR